MMPMWVFWTAILLMLVGMVGILIPAFPGAPIIWVAAAAFVILDRFTRIGVGWFVFLCILGLAGSTADVWVSMLGARVGGASFVSTLFSLVGAIIGGMLGAIIGGVGAFPGIVVGAILGVLLNEYRVRREWRAAFQATLGLVAGFTVSTAIQLTIGGAMIAIFIWRGLA
jgi:uncharacterized protein YqgC (DUF456 family)